jgi:hypothetical protein
LKSNPNLLVADPARRTVPALVALALCGFLGCRERAQPSDQGRKQPQISRGEHVVVEPSAAEFFEARVIEIGPNELRVQAVSGGESRRVAPSDVHRITALTSPPKGIAICRKAPAVWIGCRVDEVRERRVSAVDLAGAPLSISTDDVLAPSGVTELNLRHAFRGSERRIEFEAAVARAGSPSAPRGWRPSPRERVLARDGRGWYSARIHEIEDERLHVRWQTDERISELTYADVVPEPPYPGTAARGAIVLVRPSLAAQAWAPMRVQMSGADLVVEDGRGAKKTVAARDVVPLARP